MVRERYGAWRKRRHPEEMHDFWENADTGEASYVMPADVRFYVPEAVLAEAGLYLSQPQLLRLESLFAAMDIDGSGAIDRSELKLLVARLTGNHLSEGRARNLLREVDSDKSGAIDFDELLRLVLATKKGHGGAQWTKLIETLEQITPSDVDDLLKKYTRDDATARSRRKQAHTPYCVCGCRCLSDRARRRRRRRSHIFPKLRDYQLQRQLQGGGASNAAAATTKKHSYEAATLVADHQRLRQANEPPLWSMLGQYHCHDSPSL